MGLFRCEKCGCIENTALGHYWPRNIERLFKGTEFEKALCSECMPSIYPDGSPNEEGGIWHGKFPKKLATENDRGKLLNF